MQIDKLFRLLCLFCATTLCIYCIFEYSQNRDLSEISFVKFQGTGINIYPQLSLCVWQEFIESELKKINSDFNSMAYENFLKGDIWDSRMIDLDFDKVRTKAENYVLHTCSQSSFKSPCDVKTGISTHILFWGVTCLSLHAIPDKRLFAASMWLNSSVFGNDGVRSPYDHKFVVFVSYPQQVTRFTYNLGHWDIRNSTEPYSMNFKVKDVEVLRRRNKLQSRCSDWKNYDTIVEEQALSYIGCRKFRGQTDKYLPSLADYPACRSKEKFQLSTKILFDDIVSDSQTFLNITPPCSEIKRLNVVFQEEETNVVRENNNFPSTKNKLKQGNGWFRVTVQFIKNEFKEIKQMRAYSSQSLVGNAGGYVGILVGYSISELPTLVRMIYRCAIRQFKV